MRRVLVDSEKLIEGVIRLRRVIGDADHGGTDDIERTLGLLEDIAPPTLTVSQAARILGVSHTAVNRWIDKGDITTVPTPTGRHEVPLEQVLDLVETARAPDRKRGLAHAINDRRRSAATIDIDSLLPSSSRAATGHHRPELRSLAYHRLVAQRLDDRLVADARRRLRRWEERGRIHPRWARQWRTLLEQPTETIANVLAADTERSRALRQSSPFAGALTEHERRAVLAGVEQATR